MSPPVITFLLTASIHQTEADARCPFEQSVGFEDGNYRDPVLCHTRAKVEGLSSLALVSQELLANADYRTKMVKALAVGASVRHQRPVTSGALN